jgi:hypothetical protein
MLRLCAIETEEPISAVSAQFILSPRSAIHGQDSRAIHQPPVGASTVPPSENSADAAQKAHKEVGLIFLCRCPGTRHWEHDELHDGKRLQEQICFEDEYWRSYSV